ncbi:MAG: CDP-glycerol glycerophosphotransferase family protein [Fibrobacterales bacterium]
MSFFILHSMAPTPFDQIAQQNKIAAHSFQYCETVLETLVTHVTDRTVTKSVSQPKYKVVLFALRELHVPVLLPVYKELLQFPDIDVGFMAPVFKDKNGEVAEEGLREKTIAQLLEKGIPFWGHEKSQIYNCVVTADVCHDRVDAWGPVVCVGHGTISKNIYFIDNPFVRRESFATVLCVPGPWYVNAFGGQVKCRIEPTGFTKMDELAKDYTPFKFTYFKEIGFVNTRKTILFVPTFNDELTVMDMLLEYWQKLDPNKYQILIKLHGAASEEWRSNYKNVAHAQSNIHYVEDASIVPYMKIADVVVSDLSSAYLESYVLDVPVLVGNNPQLKTCAFYNPKAVEFLAREAAYQFNSGDEFLTLIASLEQGDPMAQKRREFCSQLFMDIDGKNSWRVAQIIDKVVRKEYEFSLEKKSELTLYIPEVIESMETIVETVRNLHKPITIVTHNKSLNAIDGQEVQQLSSGQTPPQPFMTLTGSMRFATEVDKIWQLQQQWNTPAGIEGPLLNARPNNLYQQHHLLTTQRVNALPSELHIYFKHLYFHYTFPVEMLFLDGMVITDQVPQNIVAEWLPKLTNVDQLYAFATVVRGLSLPVRVMGGLYGAHPEDY